MSNTVVGHPTPITFCPSFNPLYVNLIDVLQVLQKSMGDLYNFE